MNPNGFKGSLPNLNSQFPKKLPHTPNKHFSIAFSQQNNFSYIFSLPTAKNKQKTRTKYKQKGYKR